MKAATSTEVFKGDSNPSIALAWTGDQGTLLAVTTYESFVSFPSFLYRNRSKIIINAAVEVSYQ